MRAEPSRRVVHRDHLRVQRRATTTPRARYSDSSADQRIEGSYQAEPIPRGGRGVASAPVAAAQKSVISVPGALRLRIHILQVDDSHRAKRRNRFDHSRATTIDINVVATHTAAEVAALVLDTLYPGSGSPGSPGDGTHPAVQTWTLSSLDGTALTGPLKSLGISTGDELVLSQTPWPGPQTKLRRADAIAQSNDSAGEYSSRTTVFCAALVLVCGGILGTHLPWQLFTGAAAALSISVLVTLRAGRRDSWSRHAASPPAIATTCVLWIVSAPPVLTALRHPQGAFHPSRPLSLMELLDLSCAFAETTPGATRDLPAGLVTALNETAASAASAGAASLSTLRSGVEVARAVYALTWGSLALGAVVSLVFLGVAWGVNSIQATGRALHTPLGPTIAGFAIFYALSCAVLIPAAVLRLPAASVGSLLLVAGTVAYASVSRWTVSAATNDSDDAPTYSIHRLHSCLMGASVGLGGVGAGLVCAVVAVLAAPHGVGTVRLGVDLLSALAAASSAAGTSSAGGVPHLDAAFAQMAAASGAGAPAAYLVGLCALVTAVAAILWVASGLHFRISIRGWLEGGTAALLLLAMVSWAQVAAVVSSPVVSVWTLVVSGAALVGAVRVGVSAAAGARRSSLQDLYGLGGEVSDAPSEAEADLARQRAEIVQKATRNRGGGGARPGLRRALQTAELVFIAAVIPLALYTSGMLSMVRSFG